MGHFAELKPYIRRRDDGFGERFFVKMTACIRRYDDGYTKKDFAGGNGMDYVKVAEAAEKWGISVHRIQELCRHGRIGGAVRFGRDWMIPAEAQKPADGRRKESSSAEAAPVDSSAGELPNLPMPRKSPFLHMTDLYSVPGTADEAARGLAENPEAQMLFSAGIASARGEMDKVYEYANTFLSMHSGFYAIVGAGFLLAQCAAWRGDLELWNQAKQHICEAPCKTEDDPEILSLALAAADSVLYENKNFPEWFTRGRFDRLPAHSHPVTRVYYIRHLYMEAYAVASRQQDMEGVKGLALMKMIPNTAEPMISQAIVDRTLIAEIKLRLLCAVVYHNGGDTKNAIYHLDRALDLALPDRLYGLLAEVCQPLDRLMDDRLLLKDPAAQKAVKDLYRVYHEGWSNLSGLVRNRTVASNLTPREREVAKLAAFGFTTREIAARLYITESTVKQTVLKVVQKTGVKDRSEFATIL